MSRLLDFSIALLLIVAGELGTKFLCSWSPTVRQMTLVPLLLANALVLFSIKEILHAILRSRSAAWSISSAFCLLLYFVHAQKTRLLELPLLLTDPIGATNVRAHLLEVLRPLDWFVLALIFLGPLVVIAIGRGRVRSPSIAGGVLGAALLLSFVPRSLSRPWQEAIISMGGIQKEWHLGFQYANNGLLLSLALQISKLFVDAPPHYNHARIQKILDVSPKPELTHSLSVERPTKIIFILLESFWDPRSFGVELIEDPIPRFREIARESISGSLIVPGGTANAEFEVLTGLMTSLLPIEESVAYQHYVTRPLPALPAWLKTLGYSTTAIHQGNPSVYNRSVVYPYLGFDRFISRQQMALAPRMSKDRALMEKVVEVTKAPSSQFVFALTVAAHRPYPPAPDLSPRFLKGDLESPERKELETYLQLISETDRSLSGLIEHFRLAAEPVWVVAFGDHRPPLDLRINGLDELVKRTTPYFIWSNRGVPPQQRTTATSFLTSLFMDAAGVPQAGLHRWNHYAGASLVERLRRDSNLRGTRAATGSMHRNFEVLQYDLLFGSQFATPLSATVMSGR